MGGKFSGGSGGGKPKKGICPKKFMTVKEESMRLGSLEGLFVIEAS